MGSIAEASMQLNGIFQAAQNTADMYLEGARRKAEAIIAEAEEKARRIKDESIG
jgi:vacuolar-type H+-ATPase subunit H